MSTTPLDGCFTIYRSYRWKRLQGGLSQRRWALRGGRHVSGRVVFFTGRREKLARIPVNRIVGAISRNAIGSPIVTSKSYILVENRVKDWKRRACKPLCRISRSQSGPRNNSRNPDKGVYSFEVPEHGLQRGRHNDHVAVSMPRTLAPRKRLPVSSADNADTGVCSARHAPWLALACEAVVEAITASSASRGSWRRASGPHASTPDN